MKYDYFMTEQVVSAFTGLCFPQYDTKLLPNSIDWPTLEPFYDLGRFLQFNIGKTLRGERLTNAALCLLFCVVPSLC